VLLSPVAAAQDTTCKLYKVNASVIRISKDAGSDVPVGSLESGDIACVTRRQGVKGEEWGYVALRLEKPNVRAPVDGWAMLRDLQELSPTEAAGFAALAARPTTAAAAVPWLKHSFSADGFEIEYPGTPRVTPTNMSEQAKQRIVRSTDYLQDTWDFKYFVHATLFKQAPDFEEGVKANASRFKCRTTSPAAPIKLSTGQARELRGTDCLDTGSSVEARFYAAGKWFYQVIAVFKKDGGDATAAHRFVESFTLVKK
jgi:hypothetical protein